MKKILTEQIGKLLSSIDDNNSVLCMLEQLIGGSMIDAIIEEPDQLEHYIDIIIDGNDEWDACTTDVQKEIIEILKKYK